MECTKNYRSSTCILDSTTSSLWMLPLGWNRVLCDSTGHLLPAAFVSHPSSWAAFLPPSTESLLSLYFLKADPCLFLESFFSLFCELLENVVSSGSSQLPLKTNYLIQSTAVEFYDFPLYPDMEKDYVLPCQKMLNSRCPERSLVIQQFLYQCLLISISISLILPGQIHETLTPVEDKKRL